MKWTKTVTLFFFVLLANTSFSQSKYIQKYRPLADSLGQVYGIPAAIILGVAVIESGSGTSRNAKLLNNHFGIVGKNNLLKTKGVKTRYKQYPDVAASYLDFCKLLSRRKYYAKLKGNNNYKLWVDAISKSGYTEAPAEWKKRVTAAIQQNKLSANKY
jgi:Bax protein